MPKNPGTGHSVYLPTGDRRFPPPLLIVFRSKPRFRHIVGTESCVGNRGQHMKTATPCRGSSTGKSLINEKTYPYLVEIPVAAAGLGVPLNRQIMKFHESRHIKLRHGRQILRGDENYYRWCFPDLMTALSFVEQCGGAFYNPEQTAFAG